MYDTQEGDKTRSHCLQYATTMRRCAAQLRLVGSLLLPRRLMVLVMTLITSVTMTTVIIQYTHLTGLSEP